MPPKTIQRRRPGRGRNGRPVRHQRRQHARGNCRLDGRGHPGVAGAGRHPLPQRLRAGRGQFAGRASMPAPCRCRERINGFGERCGNADLISIIANLALKKPGYEVLDNSGVEHLTELSRFVYETANMHFRPTSRSSAAAPSPTRGACTSMPSPASPPAMSTSIRSASATNAGSWSASCRADRTSWP